MATDPFNQNRPDWLRRRSEAQLPTWNPSYLPTSLRRRQGEAATSAATTAAAAPADAMLPPSRAPAAWRDEMETSQIRGTPEEVARGRAADAERAERRNDIQARPGGRAGGGPATALIGMPEDERMRRLQIALSTTGRGSPSTRRALIEGFYGDRQREADARTNRADNDARMQVANARSQDAFAERQLEADRFNAEQAAERRAARAPMSAKDQAELLKTLADTRRINAQTDRENETHEWGAARGLNEYADERIATLMETEDMDRATAEAQVAREAYLSDAPLPDAARRRSHALSTQAEDLVNQGSHWLQDLFTGNARLPFTQMDTPVATRGALDLNSDFDIAPAGGLTGVFNHLVDDPVVELRHGEGSRAARRYMRQSEAQPFIEERALREARARRQREQDERL